MLWSGAVDVSDLGPEIYELHWSGVPLNQFQFKRRKVDRDGESRLKPEVANDATTRGKGCPAVP